MIDTINHIIKTRRSIFPAMYTGERIDDTLIQNILENANWAPNHRKTEPWRFKVFTGAALEGLGEFLAERYRALTPPEKFMEIKYKKTKSKTLKSSHIIALCTQRDEKERIPEWEELAALSCAIQNMYLTCTAMELGCYWSSPKTILEAGEFLGLTESQKCHGLLYIGVPQEGLTLKGERGDVALKTDWIRDAISL